MVRHGCCYLQRNQCSVCYMHLLANGHTIWGTQVLGSLYSPCLILIRKTSPLAPVETVSGYGGK